MMIEPFAIHSLACPPGIIGICRLPGRSGDLAGDVAIMARWGARIVVSMTEAAEADEKGGAGLAGMLCAQGIAHLVFPIRDFGVPDIHSAAWGELGPMLHAALDDGARILLHCLGGQGRSGMVALRLMVERGQPPAEALAAIRAVRPGAVETEAQHLWGCALSCRPSA